MARAVSRILLDVVEAIDLVGDPKLRVDEGTVVTLSCQVGYDIAMVNGRERSSW